jgi:hypothetical protein
MLEISARTRHAFNTIWPSGDFLKLSDVKNRIDQNGMFNFPERPEFEIYARLLELLECDLWDKSNSLEGLIGQFFQPNPSSRVICLDLGSLDRERQALLVAEAALDSLWTSARSAWNAAIARPRDEDTRCPVFVVIDEAHNLAPEQASSRTSGRVTEILTRIAMEGRKYGLFLILATQRPSRLSANLLSQCDNLVLMKMSNPADVALVKERFGFISTNSAARALAFEQGQMILAGRFVENELAVSVFPRRTMEGGRSLRDESWLLESEGEQ